MPPLQALVALHGLWVLALLSVVVWAVQKWPPPILRLVGYAATALGVTGLAVLVGRELLTWYPAVTPTQQRYLALRILYVLGTNTDVPVVQVILAGIVLWIAARRRKRDELVSPQTPRNT
jgi:hypothetical protein